ncbi:hypothetical protein [Mesorhizobium sp.]|uniref:hypothetical protein n=1 Tax=Mesorhizobium sp. TaxID=1871066 RepID=UPI0025804198|nr:hypothetical protein [Mesorhizobium sp.]
MDADPHWLKPDPVVKPDPCGQTPILVVNPDPCGQTPIPVVKHCPVFGSKQTAMKWHDL